MFFSSGGKARGTFDGQSTSGSLEKKAMQEMEASVRAARANSEMRSNQTMLATEFFRNAIKIDNYV